jgi:hypothetical protein
VSRVSDEVLDRMAAELAGQDVDDTELLAVLPASRMEALVEEVKDFRRRYGSLSGMVPDAITLASTAARVRQLGRMHGAGLLTHGELQLLADHYLEDIPCRPGE